MSISEALDRLSKAKGVRALIDAHQKAARAVLSARRSDASLGALARVWREAMRMADQMKAEGTPAAERQAFIATALREAWPKTREEPWHYLCQQCDDTGWVFKTCVQGSCGRPFTLPGQASDDHTGRGRCAEGHSYCQPCWCLKGQGFKRNLLKAPRPTEDAVEAAARTGKPTRAGR